MKRRYRFHSLAAEKGGGSSVIVRLLPPPRGKGVGEEKRSDGGRGEGFDTLGFAFIQF